MPFPAPNARFGSSETVREHHKKPGLPGFFIFRRRRDSGRATGMAVAEAVGRRLYGLGRYPRLRETCSAAATTSRTCSGVGDSGMNWTESVIAIAPT